jgi:hypothetical protein
VPTLLIMRASQVIGADLQRTGTCANDLPTLYRRIYQHFHGAGTNLTEARFWASEDARWVAVECPEPRDRCHTARGPDPIGWIEYVDARRSDGTRFVRVIAADVATVTVWRDAGLGTLVGGRTETRQRHEHQEPLSEQFSGTITGSLSLNVTTYVMRTDGSGWDQVPPPPARGDALSRYLDTPEDSLRREAARIRRMGIETDTSGVQVGRASRPARGPLPSNAAITARPVAEIPSGPLPPAFASLGDAMELDREPHATAEDHDLHAERYRMLELD